MGTLDEGTPGSICLYSCQRCQKGSSSAFLSNRLPTEPSPQTKTAETRAQTVSIPYLANPGIAAGSRAYLKAIHVLSKATPTASNSRKRARIEKPVADIREEDLGVFFVHSLCLDLF